MSQALSYLKRNPLYWLGMLLLCSGLAANVAYRAKLLDIEASLREQSQWTLQLNAMLEESEITHARMSLLNRLSSAPIVPLEEVFKATFVEESIAEFSPAETRDLHTTALAGWDLERKELSFHNVPLPALMRFIKTAEKSTPPWRIDRIDVIASSLKPGYARAVLEMSSASKRP